MRPRAAGVTAAVLLALALFACAAEPESAGDASAAPLASAVAAEPLPADDFRPGFLPDDAAAAALDGFLRASLPDAGPDVAAAFLGCGVGAEPDLPAELLAGYQITGRSTRGDTVVVRARVVTVAEQDRSRREPGRYTAVQRVREGEWEWDVVREDDAWRVCAGPRFGLPAPDSLTTWRTEGASAATARALALRLRDSTGS